MMREREKVEVEVFAKRRRRKRHFPPPPSNSLPRVTVFPSLFFFCERLFLDSISSLSAILRHSTVLLLLFYFTS